MSDGPKLKSTVLCDGAMQVGRKWTLQGVFDGIFSQKFPSVPISFWIYFQIVDVSIKSESRLVVEIRRTIVEDMEGKDNPVCGAELTFKANGGGGFTPLLNQSVGFALPFSDVVFPESGVYDVSFFVDDTLIEVWSLEAKQLNLGDKP